MRSTVYNDFKYIMPPTLKIYIKDIQNCIVIKNLYDINIESILYKRSN